MPIALRNKTPEAGSDNTSMTSKKAMSIIDYPTARLGDPPALLEERLRKTPGVISVEIDAYLRKISVEFNPSLISLDRIRKLLTSKGF